jgi:hypothetical protein
MPAAANVIKMAWMPRGDAKGGTFTSATYHDMVPESTYATFQCVVDHNKWRVRYNDAVYNAAFGTNLATTIEIFNRYSGLTQTLTSSVVAGYPSIGASVPYVKNVTTGATIRDNASAMPLTVPSTGRFVFATVKNRLYMANGTDLPAISPDATASSCQPWGFAPQAPNLTYQIVASGTTTNAGVLGGSQGTCNTTNVANSVVTWVSGVKFDYFQQGAVVYINGVYWTIQSVTDTTHFVLSGNAGALAGVPFSYAPTGIIGNANYTGSVPGPALNTLTVWAPPGALPIFVVGPPTVPYGGSPAFIAGAVSPANPSVKYILTSVTGANAGTITPVFQEAVGAVTRNTQINISNITFDSGRSYLYAVSYYNPTSGHISNTSPVLNVKDGAPGNTNVSITISNIITTNDANYTKIILWRSAANGSQLFPLVILNNNNGNAAGNTITYTDFLGDDTALGTAVGGPGKVVAPRGENAQPPTDLNYIAYWDGRFWGASQTQIGILFFSARSAGNSEDVSAGVPEECWPPNFTRVIPESDSRITGLRTVGNNLFVLTDNNIYAVVGSNRDNYGLFKVSSKGKGTSHFNTCVIPGEDVNSTDVMVHVGNDHRIYFLFASGGDFDISYPIQDQFALFPVTAVGVQHTNVSTYVVVSNAFNVFLYDLERKIWLTRTLPDGFGAGAYAEGLLSGTVVQLFGSSQTVGTVYQAELASGTPQTFAVVTNQVSPGGGDDKDDKTLQAVTVYYTNRTDTLNVYAYIDTTVGNVTGSGATVTLTEVPNTTQYAAYFENPDARIFVPQGVLAGGRIFQFTVRVTNPSALTNNIFKIGAVWSDTQDPIAKGANL